MVVISMLSCIWIIYFILLMFVLNLYGEGMVWSSAMPVIYICIGIVQI